MSEETDRANAQPSSEDRLSLLWRRVKEHRIAQWTVGYVAVAYGIQHAVILTSESFEWPNAVARVTMLLLALGLPLAMTLAWYHGARASRVSHGELAIVSTLLVIGAFLFYVFARPADDVANRSASAPALQQASAVPSASPAQSANGISLAVLPFANVSGDPGQEFFSDGISDEIMTALAKITALRVVGRESAFQFKGKSQDNRAVGQALGATYLIEGSVRKAGDRVRITAQLVQSDNGVSLWTESYDRELKDIFVTQEDVARAIAGALRVPLGLRQGDALVPNRTIDFDAYQEFLRAQALYRSRESEQAIRLLEALTAREPAFAPAWALLSRAYEFNFGFSVAYQSGEPDRARRLAAEALAKAEAAAQRAIQIDPNLADGHVSLGRVRQRRGEILVADRLFTKALMLDPNNAEALHQESVLLAAAGRTKEALALRQRLQTLEPFVPLFVTNNADILWLNGQTEAAIAMLMSQPANAPRVQALAKIYASAGQYKQAADTLLTIPREGYSPGVVEAAVRLLRAAPARVSPANLSRLGDLDFVGVHVGAPEHASDFYAASAELGYAFLFYSVWHPSFAAVRKTTGFKSYARKAGLVDYWRAKGWPDLCKPVGADDFACE